ncbi:Syd protein [Streptomyces sp. NBRC 110611]|uniref:hypothetical protein n=1 Tax=Streptomyces sp. NBRC 110611 TaxID=1621259 RepID=UPI000836420C|nr:hypothetical protein [Streptomyces sp. NBRC 110611]GAU64844.1 Syd protein [Streptomyces sp. NBRC 110611]
MHLPPRIDEHPVRSGRFRSAWRAAHEPVAGVSRRLHLTAWAVVLAVLPSSLWRLPVAFAPGGRGGIGERLYVVFLSVLSEALAFTAFGLIARWGEVFPRWLPLVGGRRVPTMAAVVPAATGAALLTFLWTVLGPVTQVMGTTIRGDALPGDFPGEAGGWEEAWFHICYTPLILWGPLLAVLTIAYWRRRRADERKGSRV